MPTFFAKFNPLRGIWNCHVDKPTEKQQQHCVNWDSDFFLSIRFSQNTHRQEPIFLSRHFHRAIYYWFEFISRIQIPTGTSVTNCNHKHRLMLTCPHVHVRPHFFILPEACSCRLELAGKISKNRLVCKNAVAFAYYGSCRLLVMGSWLR